MEIHLQQKVNGTLQGGNGAPRVEEVSNYIFDVRTYLSEPYHIFNGYTDLVLKNAFFTSDSWTFLQASSNPRSETARVRRNAQEVCACVG